MSFFAQVQTSELYAAQAASPVWLGYLLPQPVVDLPGIELDAALHNNNLNGSFIVSAVAPNLADPAAITAFIKGVRRVLTNPQFPSDRGMLWLANPSEIDVARVPVVGLNSGGTAFNTALTIPIVPSLSLVVANGAQLSLDGTALTLTAGGRSVISFTGGSAPPPNAISQVFVGILDFAGPRLGCVVFETAIERSMFGDPRRIPWGFQFVMPAHGDPVRTAIAEWLPLAFGDKPSSSDRIPFRISIDASDPFNAHHPDRTDFVFTSTTTLASCFVTTNGAPIDLQPVLDPLKKTTTAGRLVFSKGVLTADGGQEFQLAPEGDYLLQVPGATQGQTYELMCGLQGTESIAFLPRTDGYDGDRLRFASRRPAFADRYPFITASPVGPPIDPAAPLLVPGYTTSWVTIVRSGRSTDPFPYVAQPSGAWLYGKNALISSEDECLIGGAPPAELLPPGGDFFPIGTYLGARKGDGTTSFSPAQVEDFERQVIAPTRRSVLGGISLRPRPRTGAELPGELTTITTPSGLLVTLDDSTVPPTWRKIMLGLNVPTDQQIYFCRPDAELQQVFQTNQLFLVVANPTHLGTLAGQGSGDCNGESAFYNQVTIGGWTLRTDVGQNTYGNYSNVLIIKGRQGALYNPTSEQTIKDSLVSNPEKWTQKDAFAAPTDGAGPVNPGELTALSSWLQTYFDDAVRQADTEYFSAFNAIARDPNWTGVLVLRATIEPPPDLAGITAGITAPERFRAHHLGFAITPVTCDAAQGIAAANSSSMFGLIYYIDPTFVPPAPDKPVQPIPPRVGVTYDFRVLTLKVLFQNTAVRSFQSYAQITLNRLFGMDVAARWDSSAGTANPYNTIVLRGSYQDNGGQPVYSLTSSDDTCFYFDSNVVNKVEIVGAQMSIRGLDPVVTWFGLNGFLDFKIVTSNLPEPASPFDVFSFGNQDGANQLRKGLSFSNLGLRMDGDTNPSFAFVAGEISFDLTTSTPRKSSLFQDFALELQGLAHGTKDEQPADQGYLPVITHAVLSGVGGGEWYGIAYRLSMGTPGELAGDVGLNSTLLTAWSSTSAATGAANAYRATVGLQLPGTGGGAKLISLQTVLKLSIGQLLLTRAIPYKPPTPETRVFLLLMTEIALKFLGVLKIPPSGSTLFYLFGNPESEGKPSGLGWYAMYKVAG